MKRFLLMVQLMTRIPVPITVKVENSDLGKGTVYFPLIGIIIGLILVGIYQLFFLFFGQGFLLATLVVLGYLGVSGGLHFDGLSDTFDGLLSNRSRERILEIMQDSRLGVFGTLSLLMTVLLQIGSISRLNGEWQWLILAPMLGRYGCVFAATISRYARSAGMGKYYIEYSTQRELLLASLYTWPLTFWLCGVGGLAALGGVIICTYSLCRWTSNKIGGITGDILGAVIELNQVVVLLLAASLIII